MSAMGAGRQPRVADAEPQTGRSAESRDALEMFRIARDPARVRASDVLSALWPDADQLSSPDGALLAVVGTINGAPALVLGQEKPKGKGYDAACRVNFGMMRPEGYAFAVEMLARAEANGWPVVTLIDTPGADPSEHAAANLQSWRISECITAFCSVRTPTVSLILGEGGSGGALAMQATDVRLMMQNALYSVIAPESCGSILFRDTSRIRESLELLRPSAERMLALGIVDEIVFEPREGALAGDETVTRAIGEALSLAVRATVATPVGALVALRQARLRNLGRCTLPRSEVMLPRLSRRDSDLSSLTAAKLIDLSRIAEEDGTDGIAYGYLVDRLRRQNCKTDRVILCAPDRGGCGAYLDVDDYLADFKSCRHCGAGEKLDVEEWAACLLDDGGYQEMYPRLTVDDLEADFEVTPTYREQLERARRASGHAESLVVARATIRRNPVVVALSNFRFMGGSMGSVMGEKIVRAAEYAIEHDAPLVSLCCSGGARMQEGTLSLVQMARTNSALARLAERRGLFISVLANPTTGGALASYVARGDVILAEPGALVAFAGPRVVELSGCHVPTHVMRPDFLQRRGGIHEVVGRRGLAAAIARYVDIFYRLRKPQGTP